jgi:hypothetical protein
VKEIVDEGESFVNVWKASVDKIPDTKNLDEALMRHSLNQVSLLHWLLFFSCPTYISSITYIPTEIGSTYKQTRLFVLYLEPRRSP